MRVIHVVYPRLLIEKEFCKSDATPQKNTLIMPLSKIKQKEILNLLVLQDEKVDLYVDGPNENPYKVDLVLSDLNRCDSKPPMSCLKTPWKQILIDHSVKDKMIIQLWVFRNQNNLDKHAMLMLLKDVMKNELIHLGGSVAAGKNMNITESLTVGKGKEKVI